MAAGLAPAYAAEPLRLPDTEITRVGKFTAYLIDPTTRYDHGVLGDTIEAGGFAVERDGRRLIYRLPETQCSKTAVSGSPILTVTAPPRRS